MLRSQDREFSRGVALGLWPEYLIEHKFGLNDAVGASLADIRTEGGVYVWPLAATTLEVISTDAGDTAAGLGARSIRLFGVDALLNAIDELVVTNGTLASNPTSKSFFRFYRGIIEDAGVYANSDTGSNLGTITIRSSGVGQTHGVIDITNRLGRTEIGAFTIPAGKVGLLNSFLLNVDSNFTARVFMWLRPRADVVSTPFSARHLRFALGGFTGHFAWKPKAPLLIDEKTDIWWSAIASGAGASISVDFELEIEPKES